MLCGTKLWLNSGYWGFLLIELHDMNNLVLLFGITRQSKHSIFLISFILNIYLGLASFFLHCYYLCNELKRLAVFFLPFTSAQSYPMYLRFFMFDLYNFTNIAFPQHNCSLIHQIQNLEISDFHINFDF